MKQLDAYAETLKQEFKVAFSLKTQPLWFRILKWSLFLGICFVFSESKYLIHGIIISFGAGLTMHFIYRAQTKTWTQSWGLWKKPDI